MNKKYYILASKSLKRRPSANGSITSSVGAVTSLILMLALGFVGAGNVSAASTISVSSSGAQSIDVLPGSSGSGTSIGVDEITVSTTCRAGYNFSLSTSVNDNNLYLNGSNSNNESGKYFTPADGTTTLDSSTNTWGYYYNSSAPTTAPTSANTFLAVPTLSSTAAIIKTPATTASSTDIADTFNIYYGVSASSNLTPGTYKMIPDTNNSNVDGSIVYYVTMAQNCLPYTVVFNPTSTAGGTTLTGSGTMSDQTIQPGVATALATNTFTAPTGYEFDSWNTAQDGTGTSYTDGQSVTDLTTGGTSITLYAQWKEVIYMQDMSFSECTTTPKTVYDKRDNQAYTVAKLADGKCWMTTNLNIAGGTELSSTDTDFESTYTLPTTDGWTTNNGKLVLPASDYSSGFGTDNYAYVYNTGNETSACTSPGCYSYYSWDAATLGSGRSISTDNTDAPYSICPKGWHLPNTYNGSGTAAEATDFRALMIALGGSNSVQTYNSSTTPTGATISSALQADPYNFLLGGYYDGGSFDYVGSYGYYWSATSSSSSTGARRLYFDSTGVTSANGDTRRTGFSVRCLKEKPIMQSVTSDELAELMPNEGDTTTLKDARDGQEYTIAKINGAYWMTQNLALGSDSTIALTQADSNVPSYGYALPARSTNGTTTTYGQYVWGNDTQCTSSSTTACAGYYSYAAATAGTNPSSGDSSYDICPANWRLPTSAELTTLKNTYTTGATLTASPFLGVYAGIYFSSSFSNGGSGGYYWSSTAYSRNDAYLLYFYSSSANVDYNDKSNGRSIRCVAKS